MRMWQCMRRRALRLQRYPTLASPLAPCGCVLRCKELHVSLGCPHALVSGNSDGTFIYACVPCIRWDRLPLAGVLLVGCSYPMGVLSLADRSTSPASAGAGNGSTRTPLLDWFALLRTLDILIMCHMNGGYTLLCHRVCTAVAWKACMCLVQRRLMQRRVAPASDAPTPHIADEHACMLAAVLADLADTAVAADPDATSAPAAHVAAAALLCMLRAPSVREAVRAVLGAAEEDLETVHSVELATLRGLLGALPLCGLCKVCNRHPWDAPGE